MDEAIDSCVRLSVAFNGTTVNGQGNTVSATVSVPCNNAFPTVNPCGTNGSWTPPSAEGFTGVNDSKSISCPSTCSPVQVGTLVAKFNGANEVLQLTASTHGAIANVSDENGGVEESILALADRDRTEPLGDATRRRSSGAGPSRRPPATNDTPQYQRHPTCRSRFEYWCGNLTPAGAAGVPLVSLADTMLLPGAAGTRYEASRVAFLPAAGQLKLKDITSLSFTYDVVVWSPRRTPSTAGWALSRIRALQGRIAPSRDPAPRQQRGRPGRLEGVSGQHADDNVQERADGSRTFDPAPSVINTAGPGRPLGARRQPRRGPAASRSPTRGVGSSESSWSGRSRSSSAARSRPPSDPASPTTRTTR